MERETILLKLPLVSIAGATAVYTWGSTVQLVCEGHITEGCLKNSSSRRNCCHSASDAHIPLCLPTALTAAVQPIPLTVWCQVIEFPTEKKGRSWIHLAFLDPPDPDKMWHQ